MITTMTITNFLDDDGIPIVSVPLTNCAKKAVLYQDDFNMLLELGLDQRWRLTQNMVIVRGSKKVTVARMVANAKGNAYST